MTSAPISLSFIGTSFVSFAMAIASSRQHIPAAPFRRYKRLMYSSSRYRSGIRLSPARQHAGSSTIGRRAFPLIPSLPLPQSQPSSLASRSTTRPQPEWAWLISRYHPGHRDLLSESPKQDLFAKHSISGTRYRINIQLDDRRKFNQASQPSSTPSPAPLACLILY